MENTCPVPDILYRNIMSRSSHSTTGTNLFNSTMSLVSSMVDILTVVGRYVVLGIRWPVNWTLRLISFFTVSPILWFWSIFSKTFETVITPIFYFAAIAGSVGVLGGLAVGGLALCVQWLIPIDRQQRKKQKQQSMLLERENTHNTVFSTGNLLRNGRIGDASVQQQQQKSALLRPRSTLKAKSPTRPVKIVHNDNNSLSPFTSSLSEPVLGYEDEDGYSMAYSVKMPALPQTPPNDYSKGMESYFESIREEESEDSSSSGAVSSALKTSVLYQRQPLRA